MSHRLLVLFTAFLGAIMLAGSAAATDYNDNCAGQIPTNQAGKWFGSCPDPTYGQTNWVGNVLPGPGDVAAIGPEFGSILVNGIATVMGVSAPGGLTLDFSAYELQLGSGMSNITGLVLTNNASLRADAAAVVNLSGTSELHSDLFGPGSMVVVDAASLNGVRLRTGVTLDVQGSATHDAGIVLLNDGDTTLMISSSLDISGFASSMNGTGALLLNQGVIDVGISGPNYFIGPNYRQEGDLNVTSGTLELNGESVQLKSGSIVVSQDATLKFDATTTLDPINAYDGLTALSGGGLVDAFEEFDVLSPLEIQLGAGEPGTGTGGFRLQSALILDAVVTNRERFRFRFGTLRLAAGAAADVKFVNEGWAYTRSVGSATIDAAWFTNNANFLLGGGGLFFLNDGVMQNAGLFIINAGAISGAGQMTNELLLRLDAIDPLSVSTVGVIFENESFATVEATSGHLVFSGLLLNLTGSTLSRGFWVASSGATITFPQSVTELNFAAIAGDKASFPNVDLTDIRASDPNQGLSTKEWDEIGDLFLDDGRLEVKAGGSGMSVGGTISNTAGSSIEVESGATLTADGIDNGEEFYEAASELSSTVVIAKGVVPQPAATLITPTLNNRGRILPGGEGAIGEIHLMGDYTQFPRGSVQIEVSPAGVDVFSIDGNALLAGDVSVKMIDGFVPTVGQQFTFLTVTGTISQGFDSVTALDANGYSLSQTANGVVLTVDSVVPTASDSFGGFKARFRQKSN